MEFIDIHCHILPGVDDGPADVNTSLEMARIAVADGITTIVATPHIIEGIYDGADRDNRLEQFRMELRESGINLKLVSGAEVPMSLCLAGDGEFLRSLAITGGRYLLMETAETTFEQVAQAAYRVRLCGLNAILAHPERTQFVQENPTRLGEIIERDEVYCQVTAASLTGAFGKKIQRTCLTLARSGMVHLVASDAHSTGKRAPRLSDAHSVLVKALGMTSAQVIMLYNPGRILTGDKLECIAAADSGSIRRGLLARIMRKL